MYTYVYMCIYIYIVRTHIRTARAAAGGEAGAEEIALLSLLSLYIINIYLYNSIIPLYNTIKIYVYNDTCHYSIIYIILYLYNSIVIVYIYIYIYMYYHYYHYYHYYCFFIVSIIMFDLHKFIVNHYLCLTISY